MRFIDIVKNFYPKRLVAELLSLEHVECSFPLEIHSKASHMDVIICYGESFCLQLFPLSCLEIHRLTIFLPHFLSASNIAEALKQLRFVCFRTWKVCY